MLCNVTTGLDNLILVLDSLCYVINVSKSVQTTIMQANPQSGDAVIVAT